MKVSPSFIPNFVLIDFENVQPKNLSLLSGDHFQIYLFLGAKQASVNVDIVEAMYNFGRERAKYIRVEQSGKNALDFYLTFYLGQLAAENPYGYFHIISKDKGFDPLIAHLVTRGINARRRDSLLDIPILSVTKNSKMEEKMKAALMNLKGRGASKPRKEKTLKNTLKHMFQDDLTESETSKLFQKLIETKHVTLKGDRLTYKLSA